MSLEGALTPEEQHLVTRYKAWCRSAHGYEEDCLGDALVAGKYFEAFLRSIYNRPAMRARFPDGF